MLLFIVVHITGNTGSLVDVGFKRKVTGSAQLVSMPPKVCNSEFSAPQQLSEHTRHSRQVVPEVILLVTQSIVSAAWC